MSARQDSDNLAWDRYDELCERERNELQLKSTVREVMAWTQEVLKENDVILVPPLIASGSHVLYPINIKSSSTTVNALFRLWFDDFRLANVLIDDVDQIVGAIDWEFSYVAPTQFILDPPWWLLLEVPEMWDDGIDDCTFDSIYWKYLDKRLFGDREHDLPPEELWKSRAHLLREEERRQMEELVQVKMEESKGRILVSWEAQKAKEHLSRFLS
ncbi:hypothetical protein G7054_g564 [Neopestalotiopsis clavispora]|nr:hypothetical protein G7054_g564 [Neopestalotiopsis clavispora]